MRILMLTPYLPYPLLSGGQIRTYNLLKKLAKSHDVTLFALIKEESERQYIPELEKYCRKVEVFKRQPIHASQHSQDWVFFLSIFIRQLKPKSGC
jgi:hypothetical protein